MNSTRILLPDPSKMLPLSHKDSPSIGIRIKERLLGLRRLIFSDKNTRNLFLFLLLNFSFAFVEFFYGMWTNSWGLITDSFHMFFDCTGVLGAVFVYFSDCFIGILVTPHLNPHLPKTKINSEQNLKKMLEKYYPGENSSLM